MKRSALGRQGIELILGTSIPIASNGGQCSTLDSVIESEDIPPSTKKINTSASLVSSSSKRLRQKIEQLSKRPQIGKEKAQEYIDKSRSKLPSYHVGFYDLVSCSIIHLKDGKVWRSIQESMLKHRLVRVIDSPLQKAAK